MTWFDYVVLVVVGISVLLSVIHGLVRELLSIASWIAAFVAAQATASQLAPLLPAAITNTSLRLLLAFLVVFVVVLVGMTLLAMLISRLIDRGGLTLVDRLLGAVFGFARGLSIVMILVLLAGLTALPREPGWRNALFSPPLEMLATVIRTHLPRDLSRHINFR